MAASKTYQFSGSTTIILSASDLAKSKHFPPLYTLENAAFNHSHVHGVPGKEFLPGNGRFAQPKDMLDELGPDGFCMIAFETDEDSNIIGTMSAKPFKQLGTEELNAITHSRGLFKRLPPVPGISEAEEGEKTRVVQEAEAAGTVKWELLASAVALRVKGMGVASVLLERCVEELRSRSREMYEERGGEGEPKLGLFLSTMKELNEGYYLRKGWVTTGEKRVEKGVMGSRDGFGVVEMVKVV